MDNGSVPNDVSVTLNSVEGTWLFQDCSALIGCDTGESGSAYLSSGELKKVEGNSRDSSPDSRQLDDG